MYGNLKRGEDTEQMGVVDWANWNRNRFPELKMLYHTPNGGKRNAAEAARFKAMGVKAGVPDLCLPVPRGGYAGLYIEMKFGKNKTTENQNEWLADLKAQGYLTVVCYSGEDATRMLETYMQQGRTIMQDPLNTYDQRGFEMQISCDEDLQFRVIETMAAGATEGNCPFKDQTECKRTFGECATCVKKKILFNTGEQY